ncbi:ankyrin [Raccoonpox virus]|uniref:Ankyrin-like protein n=1 Tax=Raccoon poxvirus TaxID=10256 RepID=A0A0G3FXI3_RACVI|nr:Ankyrin-like protein [Raccoonpox virus]AKJ93660.1 Ankyrin-like protein [Raccoonpox virus]AOP31291.1 ankyrin [Raccoonpox virus]
MDDTMPDSEYYLTLYAKSKHKNLDVFRNILQSTIPSGKYSILHIYCGIKGIDEQFIEELINKGYSPNEANDDGDYPLHIASRINNNRIISTLLTHGANPNACDKQNKTPLYYLSGNEDDVIDKINLLVEHGAKINNSVDVEGCGPLLSCTDPSEIVFKKLMSIGFEAKIVDKVGRNHIHRHLMSENPKASTIEWMMKLGISSSRADYDGNTPLHIACSKAVKNIDIIDLLLPSTDVNKQNKFGDSPLTILIKTLTPVSLFNKLISTSDSITDQLVNLCIFYDRCDILESINDKGRQFDSNDFKTAVKSGSIRCVKYLLDNDIICEDAMYYAVLFEYETMIDYLLFNHFSVDSVVNGHTCMSECVRLNNPVILSKLMLHNPTSETMYLTMKSVEKDKLDKSIIIPFLAYFVLMRPDFCKNRRYFTTYKHFVTNYVHEGVSYEVFDDL